MSQKTQDFIATRIYEKFDSQQENKENVEVNGALGMNMEDKKFSTSKAVIN